MRIAFSLAFILYSFSLSAQSFQKVADSIRRLRGIPAIGYAVFSGNAILDAGVSGYRVYRARDSVRMNDRFHIGTNTFAFTSWIAGKLVESGKIKWTTTFSSLFPEFKNKIRPEFQNTDLKSLLSNTAALAPYRDVGDFAMVPFFSPDVQKQRKEFAAFVLQKPGLNPGRQNKMVESIAGYTIAAAMLEKVSGMSWEKMIEAYVNKPLGITVKLGWPNAISPTNPSGHWSRPGAFAAEPSDTWVKPYPATMAAKDINITIGDYAKFLQQELRGLRGEKSYLSQRTLELILFGLPDYSFGWNNGVIEGERVAYHAGESFLFNSYVELIPGKNLGVLVVCNSGDPSGKGGVLNLCRILADYYLNKK